MPATAVRSVLVEDAAPLGDVVLAPRELTGVPPAQLAQAMTEHLLASGTASGAEALSALRQAFPHAPLTVRVAALAALMRR